MPGTNPGVPTLLRSLFLKVRGGRWLDTHLGAWKAAPSTASGKFKKNLASIASDPPYAEQAVRRDSGPDRIPPHARHPPRLVPRSSAARSLAPAQSVPSPGSRAELAPVARIEADPGVREGPMLVDVMSPIGRYTPSRAGCGVRLPSAPPLPDLEGQWMPHPVGPTGNHCPPAPGRMPPPCGQSLGHKRPRGVFGLKPPVSEGKQAL